VRVVGSLATKYAPPYSLILHYFIAGIIFNILGILSILLFAGGFNLPFYTLKYAASVHLLLLGFIVMIIFGALYQLIPVALEIPVYSFKIGYIQFYLYLIGIVLFVFSLFKAEFFHLLPIGAMFIYISILLFIANFLISLRNLEVKSITSRFLIAANISLFIGASIGVFLSFNFIYGFYPKIVSLIIGHIVFTLFGFVFMVIMGVSMVLLPMFSLAHKFNDKYINAAFVLAVISIFIGGPSIVITGSVYAIEATFILIAATLFLYILQISEIYKRRPRKTKDIGIDTMFLSHFILILAILAYFSILISKHIVFTAFILTVLGFINTLIYGSLYKIIPFLTWFHRFSSLVGKRKVPMLSDMLPKKLPGYQITIFLVGLLIIVFSEVFNLNGLIEIIGIITMAFGSLLFLYAIFYVLNFKLEE